MLKCDRSYIRTKSILFKLAKILFEMARANVLTTAQSLHADIYATHKQETSHS